MNIFVTTSLNIQEFLHRALARMAQVVEWKAGYPRVRGSLLAFHILFVCLNWVWFTFNIKICLSKVKECDGEDGRAVD